MIEEYENTEKPASDAVINPLDEMSVVVRGTAFNKVHDLLDHLDTDELWHEFTAAMRQTIPPRLVA